MFYNSTTITSYNITQYITSRHVIDNITVKRIFICRGVCCEVIFISSNVFLVFNLNTYIIIIIIILFGKRIIITFDYITFSSSYVITDCCIYRFYALFICMIWFTFTIITIFMICCFLVMWPNDVISFIPYCLDAACCAGAPGWISSWSLKDNKSLLTFRQISI